MTKKSIRLGNRPFLNTNEEYCLNMAGHVYPLLMNGDPLDEEELKMALRGFDIMLHGLEGLGPRFALAANEIRARQQQLIQCGVARGIYKY